MCEADKRLVAWLDHELGEDEAAEVERHVKMCAECRKRADTYERASTLFNAYCNAISTASAPERTLRPKLVGAAAVAAVFVFVLFAMYSRRQMTEPQPHVSVLEAPGPQSPAVGAASVASPRQVSSIKDGSMRARPKNVVAPVHKQDVSSFPAGPAVQATIPAEALLPPGATPAGANFVVDFSVAPDGSAQGIRLKTQLTGFERRATEP